MAAVPSGAPTMRDAGLGPLVLSGVLAVGAVSGLLLALSVGGLSMPGGGGIDVADGELAEAAIGRPSETETRTTEAVDPTTTTMTSSVSATSLGVAPPVSDPELELWSGTTMPLTAEELARRTYGVFASRNVDARLASYLLHDGIVVTSAAAVSGRSELWIQVAGRWVSASVAMSDPYTDVAVLQTADPLPENLSSSTAVVGRPEPGAKVSVRLGPTDEPTGAPDRENDPHDGGPNGVVAALDQAVKTSLNRTCYDAFMTSLRSSDAPPGSVVVDDDGTAIGMTLSTSEATASAVPMETVIAVAHSMIDNGSAASVWLGIEAGLDSEGRTRVIDVATTGPASDVLVADDVIVSIDGRAVENPDHLVHLVRTVGTDEAAEMVIERDGATESVTLRPAAVSAKR